MSHEISNFYLSKPEYAVLKHVYNAHEHHGVPETDSITKTVEFRRLCDFGLINLTIDDTIAPMQYTETGEIDANCYCVNDAGEQYIRVYAERHKTDRRYWITTGIAIIALIKSFIPEIHATVAWLLKLLMK